MGEQQNRQQLFKAIRFSAIELLARREHSAYQLQVKLQSKFEQQTIIEAVIKQLGSEKLQSDSRFAEAFVRYRFNRGQGAIKIQHDLQSAGVSNEIINRAINSFANQWVDNATQVLAKKIKQVSQLPASKAKALRFLAQRGFTAEQAYSAWQQLIDS